MKEEFTPTVKITWINRSGGCGCMEIYKDQFLKASRGWVRKWLKIAQLDYEHETEILKDLSEYLEFNIERLSKELKAFPSQAEIRKKELARQYVDAKDEYNRIKNLFKTGKNPGGTRVNIRPTEGEVRRAKNKPKEIETEFKSVDKAGRDLEKSLIRAKENAEVIRERLEAIY